MDSIDQLMDIDIESEQGVDITDSSSSELANQTGSQAATMTLLTTTTTESNTSHKSHTSSSGSTVETNDDDVINDGITDDDYDDDDDVTHDVNEEDRLDDENSDDEEVADADDDETSQLIIAVNSDSGVIAVPRETTANSTSSRDTTIRNRSSAIRVLVGSLSSLSAAVIASADPFAVPVIPSSGVGSDSDVMLSSAGSVRSSASTMSSRRRSDMLASSTGCSTYLGPAQASATTSSISASNKSVISLISSSFGHPYKPKKQFEQKVHRPRPVSAATDKLVSPITVPCGTSMPASHRQNLHHYTQQGESSTLSASQQYSFLPLEIPPSSPPPAAATQRTATQYAEALRRRTDMLTQKCLRLQNESLKKANELRELSSKLKTLNVDESIEHEYQLRLASEYQRVKGVARKALAIMQKVSMAETLLSATRDVINVLSTAGGEEKTMTSNPPSSIFAVNDEGVSFPLMMASLP